MDSFEKQWQRWFAEDTSDRTTPPAHGWTTSRVVLLIVGLLALFILIDILKGVYTEWLWFSSLGYGTVYTTILKTKVLIFFSAAIIFCLLFLGNLVLTTRLVPKAEAHFWPWAIVRQLQSILRLNIILGTALLSLIFGLLLGARRVASTKFPKNKIQKMMAAEKKISTLVFRIVV